MRKCDTKFGDFVKYQMFFKTEEGIESFQVYISSGDFKKIRSGIDIKELNLPPHTINFIKNEVVPRDELGNIIKTGYVTNATANSVVFYAFTFLNSLQLTPAKIVKLREKYSLENLEAKIFTAEELLNNFLAQSAFFLNLHSFMTENDRFRSFVEKEAHFKRFFPNLKDAASLLRHYDRRIYHTQLDCEAMTSDYSKNDVFHPNTGVFSSQILTNKIGFYALNSGYLSQLGMKECASCSYKKEKRGAST
ncbi:hypothetical protein EGI11_02335 [Chryseobacterium sp. H3056]|uniref:Uncharacterized protein n=1 Tax=Kaistella daneshvariae TaxID=2487074 RepID=A0A3N0X0C5_9FLAO|nr:hypothetical protein [Kaistella daneshvariae]ROI10750.1 hypothetical protein EGI11_02335 [Kaistella daneshvariae]